jgi:hypothetical protein
MVMRRATHSSDWERAPLRRTHASSATAPVADRHPAGDGGHDDGAARSHSFGDVAVHASDLADAQHVPALTKDGEVHIGHDAKHLPRPELDALLAHEAVHIAQQSPGGGRTADPLDLEAEAHALAPEVLAGNAPAPRLAAPSGSMLAQTPYDKMVVERAKKRLALLEQYVTEYTIRATRRLGSQAERDELLAKREKMDSEGFNPFEEIEQRGKLDASRITALNTRPLNIEVTATEVRIRVKFHVQFAEEKHEAQFDTLKSNVQRGIEQTWNQRLRGATFGDRRFSIVPEFVKVSPRATRNLDYWVIFVRAADDAAVGYPGCTLDQPPPGTPTSVTDPTCAGGVMTIPPSHVTKPDILGHELLHLFGFVDRYLMQTVISPTGATRTSTQSTRETLGRPDPLGSERGPVLAEDLALLFDKLGVYELEANRGLDVLRDLEKQGLSLAAVEAEIHRQQEIIEAGRDPRSLIRIRKDFVDKITQSAEDVE